MGSPSLLGRPLCARPSPTPRRVCPPLALLQKATLLSSSAMKPSTPGRSLIPRLHFAARTFVYLRINQPVTRKAARLTTDLPGSALVGWVSHPLDDLPIFFEVSPPPSHRTSIYWSLPQLTAAEDSVRGSVQTEEDG
jgi:hypothetical protein